MVHEILKSVRHYFSSTISYGLDIHFYSTSQIFKRFLIQTLLEFLKILFNLVLVSHEPVSYENNMQVNE